MITILEKYLGKTILLATGIITFVMGSVLFLILLLGELKIIGQGDYDLLQVITYVFLKLPIEIYQFTPIVMLLGLLIGLYTLATQHELIVMRVSGFSKNQLLRTVLMTGGVLVIVFTLLGEGIAPQLSYLAEIRKENAKHAGQSVVTASGVWLRIDQNFIHIEQVINRQLFEKVTRYQFNQQHQLEAVYFAKQLVAHHGKWMMKDVFQTRLTPHQAVSYQWAQLPWDIKWNAALLNIGIIGATEMTLHKLKNYMHYLQKNGLQANEYQYQFWQRIIQPVLSLAILFIVIPFAVSSVKKSSFAWRIVIGVGVGFGFYLLNAILMQTAVAFQVSPFYAAWLPLLICIFCAMISIYQFKE